ncbi:hypothetical protein KCP78_22480 [Salmonella enterica subsp. enterica]|nr:hypothetical protein KCP78_22480 [Salmonella enterica subsp. enterica]
MFHTRAEAGIIASRAFCRMAAVNFALSGPTNQRYAVSPVSASATGQTINTFPPSVSYLSTASPNRAINFRSGVCDRRGVSSFSVSNTAPVREPCRPTQHIGAATGIL